ncbi:App1 family protein [Halomonas heilongjiangensis]|nr:phosphatase domain-containing protein [Halomonas heilongjiangensis]
MGGRRRSAGVVRRVLHFITRPMKRDLGRGGIVVHPYRGYGSRQEVFVMGRVFRQAALGRAIPHHGVLRDVADVVRRIARHGVAGVRVEASLGANRTTATTDRDGFFDIHLPLQTPLPQGLSWHQAELQVSQGDDRMHCHAEVYIPPPETDLLVISDIDDTVMYTGVADRLRMLYRLFVQKAHQRTAFPGVAALYRALHVGADGEARRPILYVSRGPWSIYEMLEAFFQLNCIPVGPILFLREWGLSWRRPWPRRAEDHKHDLITRMLTMMEDLPCVLIGDSGQHDPEVYTRIVKEHPGRVKAIYIRRVDRRPDRERAIERLREEIAHSDCELVLAADSAAMAAHAHAKGLIAQHDLVEVHQACVDEG